MSGLAPDWVGLFLLGWVGDGIWCLLTLGENNAQSVLPKLVTGQATAEPSFLWVMSSLYPNLGKRPPLHAHPRVQPPSAHSLRALHLPPSFLLWTELLLQCQAPGGYFIQVVSLTLPEKSASVALMLGLRSLTP